MASLLKNLAPDYDSSASYVKGDRVVYNKHFYECLSSTTGTFDSDKWKEIYITKIIKGTGEASAKVSGKTGNKLVELDDQTNPNDDGLYVADCITSISKTDYDALADKTGSYVVTDDDYPLMANEVSYDNTASGLTATHVQNAIDEVNTKANEVKYSNPNLLDNPWFTVNQRGKTTANATYGVDRWTCIRGHYDINSDKTITLTSEVLGTNNSYVCQRFEKDYFDDLLGKNITFSVMLSDGTILQHSFVFSKTQVHTKVIDDYALTCDFNTQSAFGLFYFAISKNSTVSSVTIKAVKLELGSVSTLANDAPPNYATELVKCQRYYQVIKYATYISSFLSDGNLARFSIPFYTPMRAVPSVNGEMFNETQTENTLFCPKTMTRYKIPSKAIVDTITEYGATVQLSTANITDTEKMLYGIQVRLNIHPLFISADL